MAAGRLAWTHWLQGRPDEARRTGAASLARAEASGHPLNVAFALGFDLLVQLFRRDADAVNTLAKSYREYMEEYGFDLPYPVIYAVMSRPLAQRGEHDAAVALLQQGRAVINQTGVREELSHMLASLAETQLAAGCAKQGLAAIVDAREFVESTGERFWEAEIHRLEGELRRLDGENERAEACFATALEVASKQGALSLELRAATSLARQAMDAKRGPEARRRLAEVYGRFSEGFDTADLQDAARLLDSA